MRIGDAHIGYLARGLAQSFSKVIEKGVELQTEVQVTGGYGYKENYEAYIFRRRNCCQSERGCGEFSTGCFL